MLLATKNELIKPEISNSTFNRIVWAVVLVFPTKPQYLIYLSSVQESATNTVMVVSPGLGGGGGGTSCCQKLISWLVPMVQKMCQGLASVLIAGVQGKSTTSDYTVPCADLLLS